MSHASFGIVIPMFNEEQGAEHCVRSVSAILSKLPHRTVLVTVNDGSSDGTGTILGRLATEFPLLNVVTHPKNRGYGAALRTGLETVARAGLDYVLFMDSDLTNHPKDIPRFAAQMDVGHDVIKATRYSLGGHVNGIPLYRVAISVIGNRLARILMRVPLNDLTNGFRAVRVPLLLDLELTESRFPIIMEELYWLKFRAKSFTEVPVELTNRSDEQRQTAFVYRPRVFWKYLKYPLRAFCSIHPAPKSDREKNR